MTTARLRLRRWQPTDREPFAAMNADPQVMRFFPALLSRAQSDRAIDQMEEHFAEHGFGFWAVEEIATGVFAGCAGLRMRQEDVEVGCRLATPYWGHGYATEATASALAYGFQTLSLKEIVAITQPANAAARRVVEKLGFTHNPADDFYDPRLPSGHPLRPLLLYRRRPNRSVVLL